MDFRQVLPFDYYKMEAGGGKMDYITMLQQVAKAHQTTPQAAEAEMRRALQASGLDISPQLFLALTCAKIKNKTAPKDFY